MQPTAANAVTIVDLVHDLISRPLLDVVILLGSTFLFAFIFVTALIFTVSRIKGNVSVDIFSIFKIGNKKKKEKDEEEKEKEKISITINNGPGAKEEPKPKPEPKPEPEPAPVEPIIGPEEPEHTDNELLLVISKSVRFGSEMAQYKELALIKSQMNVADTKLDIIEGLLIKEYMELVYIKKGASTIIQEDQSYRIFSEIIHHQVHRNSLAIMRKVFKDNGLVRYDDENYSEYMNTQCNRMITGIKLSINSAMPSFLDPGREEVNTIIHRNSRVILDTFQDIFIDGRGLAFKTELMIKQKEKDFDEEIKKLTGINNAHKRAGFNSTDPYNCADEPGSGGQKHR
jgi:hypothetical protein